MYKEHAEKSHDLEKLFQDAVKYHQNNNLEKAIEQYLKIISVMPDSPLVNYNLGLAYFDIGKFVQSHYYYIEALKQAPENHDLLYNYALCAKKIGKFTEAVEAYTTILEHNPEEIDSLYNLACCLMDLGLDEKAVKILEKVLELSHDHIAALNNIACIYHRNGEFEQAKIHYTKLLEVQPDHEIALHLLASVEGDSSKNPPSKYIEEIFDTYSSRYDKNMVEDLHYSVPEMMRKLYNHEITSEKKSINILDLGCGTGLAGQAFHDISAELVGVDLSSNMIKIADQKEIYTSLYVSEINKYLVDCRQSFDLIIASDVFIYLGDLHEILQNLAKKTSKGTHLIFSIENAQNEHFVLRKSGRFAHNIEYIKSVCKASGWSIKTAETANIRKERFEWIEGTLFIVVRDA